MKRLTAVILLLALALFLTGCTDAQIKSALVDMGYAPAGPGETPAITPAPTPRPDNVKVVTDVYIAGDPTKVQLDKKKITLRVGKSKKLKATVKPKKAKDKSVTWTSSDESVATVNKNGKVTALSTGQATITCETSNGLTAECVVTVQPQKSKS